MKEGFYLVLKRLRYTFSATLIKIKSSLYISLRYLLKLTFVTFSNLVLFFYNILVQVKVEFIGEQNRQIIRNVKVIIILFFKCYCFFCVIFLVCMCHAKNAS
jgi:hypothetical protein